MLYCEVSMRPGGQVRGICTPSKVRGSQRRCPGDRMEGACTSHPAQSLPLASPEPLGADAFLPALTEELIWSPDIGETQLDVEFLMELLDPEELLGEGEPPSSDVRTQQGAPQTDSPCNRRKGWQTAGAFGPPGKPGELHQPLLLAPSWLLPDYVVWGPAPHRPLSARSCTSAPGAQF